MSLILGGSMFVILGDSDDVNNYGGGSNREPGWDGT